MRQRLPKKDTPLQTTYKIISELGDLVEQKKMLEERIKSWALEEKDEKYTLNTSIKETKKTLLCLLKEWGRKNYNQLDDITRQATDNLLKEFVLWWWIGTIWNTVWWHQWNNPAHHDTSELIKKVKTPHISTSHIHQSTYTSLKKLHTPMGT